MDERFLKDKFLMHEKHFAIGDRYHIYDESGEPLFYVERERFKLYADVHIYDDERKNRELLQIKDRSVFDINATMEVRDPASGELLGSFKRKGLASLIQRTWQILDSQGNVIGLALEDSLIKALIRRLLGAVSRRFGPVSFLLLPLKTDFIIKLHEREVGKFIRKWTLLDRYVLDLSADPSGEFDRRLAVGLGILLDSAERR